MVNVNQKWNHDCHSQHLKQYEYNCKPEIKFTNTQRETLLQIIITGSNNVFFLIKSQYRY